MNLTYGTLGAYLKYPNEGERIGGAYEYLGNFIDRATLAKKNGLMGIITSKDSPDDKEAIRKGMDWYYKERNYDW